MVPSMADSKIYDPTKIEVLSGLEAIRRRPSMYVGALNDPCVPVELLLQSLCHAADCAIDKRCTFVRINIDGSNVEVTYDAGMPLDPDRPAEEQVAHVFLSHLAGCHNQKKHLHVGHELCNLGLAVLNALSERMMVFTRWSDREATYLFEKGVLREAQPIGAAQGADTTVMRFRLDEEILVNNVLFDAGLLDNALSRVRHLLPDLKIEHSSI